VEIIINEFFQHVAKKHQKIDVVVALDARGFLFGPTLALRLKARFVPVRKAGKVCHRIIIH
jgi:adenine phosphoribosyltransferase